MGNINQAIDDYTKTIELDNKNQEAYLHRGNIFFNKKDYKKAVTDFEKYREINTNDISIETNKDFIEVLLG